MADLIDRQTVIDVITNAADKWDCSDDYQRGIKAGIRMGTLFSSVIPSAQPERKRGKWIAVTEDGDVYKRICSCCGREAFFQNDDPDELYDGGRYELSDFCPHCGADMREVDDE